MKSSRAGYRLVLDHPGIVSRFASLAVVPTLDALTAIDYRAAAARSHWFFLAQAADLPERLLAAAPDAFVDHALARMGADDEAVEPAAREAYRAAFRDAGVRHAICEDYRAALEEDLAQDEADRAAGRRLDCPVLVLWPEARGTAGRAEAVGTWRAWARDVEGAATSGGHLQAEDRPDEVLAALIPFLSPEALPR